MSRGAQIHRLPESLVRKIAAGEVIERPASVAKELVENALDAGACRIQVEVVEGGRHGIRVVDDGCGMSREDVALCAERHATSKLSSVTDLFAIHTLGFRGEALASIAAVSRLTVESRAAGDDEGTRLVVEGGVRRELVPVARDVGTTVDVRGLFFNTPARRKFLRHVHTETRYLTQALVPLAAAFPHIAFRVVHGDRVALDLLPGDRRLRAAELLKADPEELLWAEASLEAPASGPVVVYALLTPPALCRSARGRQYVIVRGRPIGCRPVVNAVYSGYGGLLPHGAHPQFVLWLDLDPRQVDVNVHPAKREVRFASEETVRQLVQDAVRRAMPVPETPLFAAGRAIYRAAQPAGAVVSVADAATAAAADGSAGATGSLYELHRRSSEGGGVGQLSLSLLRPASLSGTVLRADEEGRAAISEASRTPRVWQVHDKYLFLPLSDGLLIVDQHVAHERVRYEEVLDILDAEGGAGQLLLVPLTVDVSPVEMEVFRGSRDLFERLGFGVREFGLSTLLVEAVPPELREWRDGDAFHQILSDLIEELEARHEARDALAATMACHSSIRAGQRLTGQEMETLVRRVLTAREPFACPHGRPILAKVPIQELDRLFGRE